MRLNDFGLLTGRIGNVSDVRNMRNGDDVINFTVFKYVGKDKDGNQYPDECYTINVYGKDNCAFVSKNLKKGNKYTIAYHLSQTKVATVGTDGNQYDTPFIVLVYDQMELQSISAGNSTKPVNQ